MPKAKATTKPNNRWNKQRQFLLNAALTEASASHASSTSKPKPNNAERLHTDEAKAKAASARKASLERRKKRREAVAAWKEKNNLSCFGVTMTNELWTAVKNLCTERGISSNSLINEIVLEYFTRPKS